MPTQVRRKAPGSPSINPRHVRVLADAMLDALDSSDAELSILLTNDAHIQQLNRIHRAKNRPTDVLSFGLSGGPRSPGGAAPRLLGDIVISLDTAARQAAGRRRTLLAEVRWLLAHGILHLIGFDHSTPAEKKQMVAATRRLVGSAEIPANPEGSAPSQKRRPVNRPLKPGLDRQGRRN